MTDMEKLELLKAALVVAAADGSISRAETGLIMGLAVRAGVGQASLQAMIDAAQRGEQPDPRILMQSPRSARTALELLVAQARINGEITDSERDVLVRIAARLRITGDEFNETYRAGLDRADRLRKQHRETQEQ